MIDVLGVLGVAVAGGVGAVLRFVVDGLFPARGEGWPWGTVVVNVSGSFALAVLAGWASDLGPWWEVVGLGLLGGYTTFSTAMWQSVVLWRERGSAAGTAHALGMLVACVAAAALGWALVG